MSLAPASSSSTWGFVDASTPGNRRAPSTAHSRGSPARHDELRGLREVRVRISVSSLVGYDSAGTTT
jgi:hypothetical protein